MHDDTVEWIDATIGVAAMAPAKVDDLYDLTRYAKSLGGAARNKPMIVSTGEPGEYHDIRFVEENEDNIVFYTKQNPKPE